MGHEHVFVHPFVCVCVCMDLRMLISITYNNTQKDVCVVYVSFRV